MTTSASGGWRARAAKVVPSSPAVVNSINRTVTPIEPAWAGVACDNSRLAGLAGLNSTAISLRTGKFAQDFDQLGHHILGQVCQTSCVSTRSCKAGDQPLPNRIDEASHHNRYR